MIWSISFLVLFGVFWKWNNRRNCFISLGQLKTGHNLGVQGYTWIKKRNKKEVWGGSQITSMRIVFHLVLIVSYAQEGNIIKLYSNITYWADFN